MPSTSVRNLRSLAGAALAVVGVAGCSVLPGSVLPSAPPASGVKGLGQSVSGQATFYTYNGNGNCSFDTDTGPLFAAMNEVDYQNSAVCGGYVRISGPRGTTTVQIVDRCPECPPGNIDLSPNAFAAIADPADGIAPIHWNVVSAGAIGNVELRVKEGSNPWWLAIQVRHHRNLVASLEVLANGSWVRLERQQYNYFVAEAGLGSGPFTVRITDIYGQQLVQPGVTLSPGAVQPTAQQFTGH